MERTLARRVGGTPVGRGLWTAAASDAAFPAFGATATPHHERQSKRRLPAAAVHSPRPARTSVLRIDVSREAPHLAPFPANARKFATVCATTSGQRLRYRQNTAPKITPI